MRFFAVCCFSLIMIQPLFADDDACRSSFDVICRLGGDRWNACLIYIQCGGQTFCDADAFNSCLVHGPTRSTEPSEFLDTRWDPNNCPWDGCLKDDFGNRVCPSDSNYDGSLNHLNACASPACAPEYAPRNGMCCLKNDDDTFDLQGRCYFPDPLNPRVSPSNKCSNQDAGRTRIRPIYQELYDSCAVKDCRGIQLVDFMRERTTRVMEEVCKCETRRIRFRPTSNEITERTICHWEYTERDCQKSLINECRQDAFETPCYGPDCKPAEPVRKTRIMNIQTDLGDIFNPTWVEGALCSELGVSPIRSQLQRDSRAETRLFFIEKLVEIRIPQTKCTGDGSAPPIVISDEDPPRRFPAKSEVHPI